MINLVASRNHFHNNWINPGIFEFSNNNNNNNCVGGRKSQLALHILLTKPICNLVQGTRSLESRVTFGVFNTSSGRVTATLLAPLSFYYYNNLAMFSSRRTLIIYCDRVVRELVGNKQLLAPLQVVAPWHILGRDSKNLHVLRAPYPLPRTHAPSPSFTRVFRSVMPLQTHHPAYTRSSFYTRPRRPTNNPRFYPNPLDTLLFLCLRIPHAIIKLFINNSSVYRNLIR